MALRSHVYRELGLFIYFHFKLTFWCQRFVEILMINIFRKHFVFSGKVMENKW